MCGFQPKVCSFLTELVVRELKGPFISLCASAFSLAFGFAFPIKIVCPTELVVRELEGPYIRRTTSAEDAGVSPRALHRQLERFAGRLVAFVDTATPGWAALHANDALREVCEM